MHNAFKRVLSVAVGLEGEYKSWMARHFVGQIGDTTHPGQSTDGSWDVKSQESEEPEAEY